MEKIDRRAVEDFEHDVSPRDNDAIKAGGGCLGAAATVVLCMLLMLLWSVL